MRTSEQQTTYNARCKAKAAERALAAGRVPGRVGQPPKYTEEQRREIRRKKSAVWRATNRERSREITRESMKRATAAKAIEEGRVPGKPGRPAQVTAEEKKAKRRAKTERWNDLNRDKYLAKARTREQAKRDGTFVSKALPRLTEEEKVLVNRAWASKRRERARQNGGSWTRHDITLLFEEQGGKCAWCFSSFGIDGFHVDHFMPLAKGGTNDPSNLQLLHPTCNLKKGARHPAELSLHPAYSAARL